MSTPRDKLRKPRIKVNKVCMIQEGEKMLCNTTYYAISTVLLFFTSTVSPFLAQEVTNRKAKTYTRF
jgi:hypothetical protein